MATSASSASSSKTLTAESSGSPRDVSSKAASTARCHSRHVYIATVVVAVFIAILIGLVVLHYKGKDIKQDDQPKNATEEFLDDQLKNGTEAKPKVCQTEACVTAGKLLFSSINFTAKPCDDFYEYACGNWKAEHTIAKSSDSVREQANKKLLVKIHEVLEQGMAYKSKGPVAKSVQFAMDYYRECMDVGNTTSCLLGENNRDGKSSTPFYQFKYAEFEYAIKNGETRKKQCLKTLKKVITDVLGISWPILDQKFKRNTDVFVETFARFKANQSLAVMFIRIESDPEHSDVNMLSFNGHVTSDGLQPFHCANRSKYAALIEAQRKLRFEYGKLFAGAKVDEKILHTRMDEILELECTLLYNGKETNAATNQTSSKMTIAELNSRTFNRIDWLAFLRVYTASLNLSYSFNSTEKVLVSSIKYYQMLSQLFVDTPSYVLYNFMSFKLAFGYGGTTPPLKSIYEKTVGAASGITARPPQWEECYLSVSYTLPWALSRLYVETKLVPGTKERAEEMIADLRAAFNEIIQNEVKWLDEDTRARALEKAAAVKFLVAYPDWIYDNAALDRLFGFTEQNWATVKKGKHMEARIELAKFKYAQNFRELREPKAANLEFNMAPITNNAVAKMSTNAITLPAAKFNPPYFEPDYPAYLNYAAIGSTIGHELTHFFDVKGSQYDKNGNIANWWSNETREHFSAGSQCFVKQYGSIVDKDIGLKLNGVKSLGENIADNGGIRAAFLAFKWHAKKSPQPLLPQMKAFTSEQLFFLANAYTRCSNEAQHTLTVQIETLSHLPNRHRVNVPLGNFEEFAKAFNCPVGSAMNPNTKCQLW